MAHICRLKVDRQEQNKTKVNRSVQNILSLLSDIIVILTFLLVSLNCSL